MSKDKRALQLGMNPATASGRLVKDTLFRLAVESGHKCFQCGEELERDSFSIEHKEPWLDSDNPKGSFFDQNNIAFSHLSCNAAAARQPHQKGCGSSAQYRRGCRCIDCTNAESAYAKAVRSRNYTKEKRVAKYKRTGN